ncbi:MAG: ATP-binding cassette domain-containing protein [Specibacter sp.]
MEAMIQTRGLRKAHGTHTVLSGVDLDVQQGEIFALLGPNGAGKTTTINILSTLLRPDGGAAFVHGHNVATNPAAVRRAISLTGQFSAVDDFQTGAENLMMMCRLGRLNPADSRRRTEELLERFELQDAAQRRVALYSGGMRRRLDLAISLITNPQIVFLDEPTTGLDPHSRARMWSVVKELAAAGSTILLTTQYLEEADQLADRVAVLNQGTIVASGSPTELKSRLSGDSVELAFGRQEDYSRARTLLPGFTADDVGSLTLRFSAPNSAATLSELLKTTGDHALEITGVAVLKPSLDDVFLALTGAARNSAESKINLKADAA